MLQLAASVPGTSSTRTKTGLLEAFVAAGPAVQRAALRGLLAVGRRPRGALLLRRAWPLGQIVLALLTLERYEDPHVARGLGWDAERVLARGRELRGIKDKR